MFEKLKAWWLVIREWYRLNTDSDYAYLCQSQDAADLERRMNDLRTKGPAYNMLFYVR